MSTYRSSVNNGFAENRVSGTLFYSVPSINALGHFKHGFFSRSGGVSTGCFESLNFSFSRETDANNVRENFRRAAEAIGVARSTLAVINYEHGSVAVHARPEHAGSGIERENVFPKCDGLVVTEPGITAVSLHADCCPVFFADRGGRAAGCCHAGWKGVLNGMIPAMLRLMREQGAEDILVGIGPHIRSCCFEVGREVAEPFVRRYGESILQERNSSLYVDMEGVLLIQLEDNDIPPENVTLSGMCTYCMEDLFFSHRRDRGQTGAMASLMCIAQ